MSTPLTATGTTAPRSSAAVLDAARAEGRSALVAYLPVGFPDTEASLEAYRELVAAGVDLIEVGVPYSDPGMDGPAIQAAVEAALASGTRTRDAITAVRTISEAGGASVVMSYWNLVLQYGVRRFAEDLASAGGSGIITPDLIPDEAGTWIGAARELGLDSIFLAAPSSTPERLSVVTSASTGFVYAASTMGVTGTRATVDTEARGLVSRLREAGAEHVCVGLGVSTAAQAAEVAEFADGVIVGSAFVRALAEGGPSAVGALARDLAAGVRG